MCLCYPTEELLQAKKRVPSANLTMPFLAVWHYAQTPRYHVRGLAAIASAFLTAMIPASLGDLVGITVGAPDLIRPKPTANFFVTLRIIHQMVDV